MHSQDPLAVTVRNDKSEQLRRAIVVNQVRLLERLANFRSVSASASEANTSGTPRSVLEEK